MFNFGDGLLAKDEVLEAPSVLAERAFYNIERPGCVHDGILNEAGLN